MKTLKKMMSFILVLSMALSLFAVTASATEEGGATISGVMTELEGNKGAELIDRESNLYTVSVDVPGGDPDTGDILGSYYGARTGTGLS